MQKSSAPGSSFPDEPAGPNAPGGPPLIGDADDAQKTTWIVGKGTNPNDRDDRAEKEPGETPNAGETRPMPRGTHGGS